MEGLFLICAGLLAVSGGAKLADPAPTAGALAAASLPAGAGWARLLGLVEVSVAVVALAFGGVMGGLAVTLLYVGFAVFVMVALRRHLPIQSCGCFGRTDTPPSSVHVVANAAAAGSGLWVAITGAGGLPDALRGQALIGLPYLAFVAIGIAALYLVLAELPLVLRHTTRHRL